MYERCWGGTWLCPDEADKTEVLVQVAPAPEIYHNSDRSEQENQFYLSGNASRHLETKKKTIVSLMHGCPNRPLHLVILVLSAPAASLRRTAIRGTWLHHFRSRVVQVTARFMIGLLDLESSMLSSLREEQKMYGDLLLLDKLKDSYLNLSAKVLLGLQWTQQRVDKFDYVIKTDDDSFVRSEEIAKTLEKMNCEERLYWGYFMGHAYPEASGKWAEQKWFNCPHYLPYAMGGGYILSRKVIEILTLFSNRLVLYNSEDVTVGSWLAPYRLVRKHDIRFDVESLSHGCNNRYLITHKERVRSFYVKYSSLIKNGTLCMQEKEIRPAYVYNWTVSPLNCCTRTKGLPVI